MCIICLKPSGVKDFSNKTLEYCWDKNQHGAGFAFYTVNGTWMVEKGLMTLASFMDAYRKHKFNEDDTVIVHFRVATSGLKDGGNTHPFPIVGDLEDMRRTTFETKRLAFHNGTVGTGGDRYSDTMEHIAEYLNPLMPVWKDKNVNQKIAEAVLTKNSSRWMVVVDNMYYEYGHWYKKDGRKYSNYNYEETVVVYGVPSVKAEYPGGGWKSSNEYGVSYPLGVGPAEGADLDYDAIQGAFRTGAANTEPPMPIGSDWGHAVVNGEYGFWRGFKFTSWKQYRKDRRWLPPVAKPSPVLPAKLEKTVKEILGVANSTDFLQRYMIDYELDIGKKMMVMNWKKYALDQQMLRVARKRAQETTTPDSDAVKHGVKKEDLVSVTLTNSGDLVWDESVRKSELLDQDYKDMMLCPNCFTDDKMDVSPFSLGSHICLNCGCVFSFKTGYIHMYDPEIKQKHETNRQNKGV